MPHTNVLADYHDLEPFAKQVGRHPRTLRRWLDKPDGLPHTRIGNRILIHIPTAQAWIFGRMTKPPSRRAPAAQHRRAK